STAGTAVIAGLLAADRMHFGSLYLPLIGSGALTAAMFVAASALCGLAMHPVGFHLPGTQPKNWDGDIASCKSEGKSLSELAKNYQEKIDYNRSKLETNARLFKAGLWCGIGAPFGGAILLGVLWLCV